MSQWRPIEAAPKDGTEFLAFCEGVQGAAYIKIVRWHSGLNDFALVSGFNDAALRNKIKPVHWMPLPAPPINK